MKRRLSAILAMGLAVSSVLTACGSNATTPASSNDAATTQTTEAAATTTATATTDLSALNGTYDITVWVSESEGVTELTQKQIDAFCQANPGIVINATVEGVSESNSASNMITDVESGADLYCFAQDQLTRLVEAGALLKLGEGASATVKGNNDNTSIKAASVGNDLYCYPLTSDNGYFMFYDKSVVAEDHIDSLEAIIKDCEDAGKMFSMETETGAWYIASFFFATGCHSDWTMAEDGSFTSVDDDFNSEAGMIAMRGMEKLVKSPSYVSSSGTADFAAATPSAVVVSGTWGAAAAKEALGDNYAVADLPSFEVDGKEYHMGSFSGCKLMGVKPQQDSVKAAVLNQLAQYLTSAKCQLERFDLVGWGPSNLEAQKNDAVLADPALVALAQQAEYAIPQGQIHGSWWDIAKVLGTNAREASSEADLKAGLEAYEASINGVLSLSDDVKNAFTMIGAFGGYNWDTDVAMTEEPAGTWTATQEFKADDEFKVRQGLSWDVNFGVDGVPGGDNVKIEADGTYVVTLVYNADGTASLTVEAQ